MFLLILFAVAAANDEAASGDKASSNQQAEHRAEVSRVADASGP